MFIVIIIYFLMKIYYSYLFSCFISSTLIPWRYDRSSSWEHENQIQDEYNESFESNNFREEKRAWTKRSFSSRGTNYYYYIIDLKYQRGIWDERKNVEVAIGIGNGGEQEGAEENESGY